MAAGIDSLGATELQRELIQRFSTDLPATLLFDHPSVDGLSSLLTSEMTEMITKSLSM